MEPTAMPLGIVVGRVPSNDVMHMNTHCSSHVAALRYSTGEVDWQISVAGADGLGQCRGGLVEKGFAAATRDYKQQHV